MMHTVHGDVRDFTALCRPVPVESNVSARFAVVQSCRDRHASVGDVVSDALIGRAGGQRGTIGVWCGGLVRSVPHKARWMNERLAEQVHDVSGVAQTWM
jgi:hypothetical protein